MYVKPEVTRYTGSELLDLMGPVETAYACNFDIDPSEFYCRPPSAVTMTFETDYFDKFDLPNAYLEGSVDNEFVDMIPLEAGDFPNSTTWGIVDVEVDCPDDPVPDPGNYTLEVRLCDEDKCSDTCDEEITVLE